MEKEFNQKLLPSSKVAADSDLEQFHRGGEDKKNRLIPRRTCNRPSLKAKERRAIGMKGNIYPVDGGFRVR